MKINFKLYNKLMLVFGYIQDVGSMIMIGVTRGQSINLIPHYESFMVDPGLLFAAISNG